MRKLEHYIEAAPATLYFQLRTCLGSMIGSHTHFEVEGDRHTTNLFLVVVGKSTKARKEPSWERILTLLPEVIKAGEAGCVELLRASVPILGDRIEESELAPHRSAEVPPRTEFLDFTAILGGSPKTTGK